MQEIRCGNCNKKLGAGEYQRLQIKCPRCGTMNHLKAESLENERPGASVNGAIHGQSKPDHPLDGRKAPPR
ncbi:Com family DNA-binding transcriptional regulator [Paucimonas lemoignei]|uniref:Com family DNA-binding transcriptional regulator n=1 Tax=Paucimonas lemoignei TaxID=29443 RepID=UPI00104E92BA|nr:Com family DNA-binding transcriptional regulator [Paucimonas lemoignei]